MKLFGLALMMGTRALAQVGIPLEGQETSTTSTIANLTVAGVTSTQAIINYTSPVTSPCTVEVSENTSFNPLVNDVNPMLFPGSNLDNRVGGVFETGFRSFVAGRHTMQYRQTSVNPFAAPDNRRYSRALQANTLHYYRITCGIITATGTFQTSNIPLGKNFNELPGSDHRFVGTYNWPTIDPSDRSQTMTDPSTGLLVKRLTTSTDSVSTQLNKPVARCRGWRWEGIVPGVSCNLIQDNNQATSYSFGARDTLHIDLGAEAYLPPAHFEVNAVLVRMKAAIDGTPTGEDRFVDVCLTINGTFCSSDRKAVDLTTCSATAYTGECANIGSLNPGDLWRASGYNNSAGALGSADFGVLIQPRTTTQPRISIYHARYDIQGGLRYGFPYSGADNLCSNNSTTVAGDPHYICWVPAGYSGQRASLYSINANTGQSYHLGGALTGTSVSTNSMPCNTLSFDQNIWNRFYCLGSTGGNTVVLAGEWIGPMNVNSAGIAVEQYNPALLRWTLLTPGSNHIKNLIAAYEPRFNAGWQANSYCNLQSTQKNNLIILCIAFQDNHAWVVAFNPGNNLPLGSGGTGSVVAAIPSWDTPATRWCALHSVIDGPADSPTVNLTIVAHGNGSTAVPTMSMPTFGAGPYRVRVAGPTGGAITATDTIFTIQPINGLYEPVDPDPHTSEASNGYLMDARPGDLFRILDTSTGNEWVELVQKLPNNQWEVRRGAGNNNSPYMTGTGFTVFSIYTPTYSHAAGTQMYAYCRGKTLARGDSGTVFWNFETDPRGTGINCPDCVGADSSQIIEHINTGGHVVSRNNKTVMIGNLDSGCPRVDGKAQCWATQFGNEATAFNTYPAVHANAQPSFEGVTGAGITSFTYHPSYSQTQSTPYEKDRSFLDMVPMTYGLAYGTFNLVSGTTSVYKGSGLTLNPTKQSTIATCGDQILRDESGPTLGNSITDGTQYRYCIARKPGECRSDSLVGDTYVSCPGTTYKYSSDPSTVRRCSVTVLPGYAQSTVRDICVGDAWAYSQSLVQASAWQSSPKGELNRNLGNIFGRFHAPETAYASARMLPSGPWALVPAWPLGGTEVFLMKVPPYPASDGFDRSKFVPVTLNFLRPNVLGINSFTVEFGYLENAPEPSFLWCTTRKETCVKGTLKGFSTTRSGSGTPPAPSRHRRCAPPTRFPDDSRKIREPEPWAPGFRTLPSCLGLRLQVDGRRQSVRRRDRPATGRERDVARNPRQGGHGSSPLHRARVQNVETRSMNRARPELYARGRTRE